ncbi:hypothetical protein ONS95_007038 [Cadophora gregata]|uniref:uncharacterized protein n=1 Tax=Cadophora gregata TaxID=51156 RepID=UPI0026DA7CA1|nr:uncharacterized protein ONS95_007038 [Cadophora gregata]KAK0100580.1 hypothetical protein ONS95_007038 [Cadophora gregata]KAK0117421.1 hypothetical protein ONS96_013251 [Cadophora gregata f. sp. sojae]
MAEQSKQPFIVMAAHAVNGHVQPIRLVASELIKRGYEVTVLLPSAYKESFEKQNLTFVPLTGIADYTEKDFDTLQPERKFWPPGIHQMAYRAIAPTRAIFRQSKGLQAIFRDLKARDPDRPIVMVQESYFRGNVPMLLRIPGLIHVPVISLGVTPYMMPSMDFPPLGVRAFPDTSEEGRAKAKAQTQALLPHLERAQREFRWVLEDLGMGEGTKFPNLMDHFQLPEAYLQMCIPSLEFPRSDAPPNLKFIGGVWASDVDEWTAKPAWWDDLGGEIISVTQGTLDLDYTELIIPTIEALKDRTDYPVVIVLGVRGATLPKEITIPPHIHVMDYVPYTELLRISKLFITNGGFNGVQQAIAAGVPILKAGNDGDKMATGNRIEWAGCGLDLWTSRPTPVQIQEGIDTVLTDPKYKKRVLEMQEESRKFDPIQAIDEEIKAAASGKYDGRVPSWKSFYD